MSNNPYYTGDEDDDIFEDTSSNSSVNSNSNIPNYLQEALEKYLSEVHASGDISDFFSNTMNSLSIEAFSLEALNATLNSRLFFWLDEIETSMFPHRISNAEPETEFARAEFVEGLIEKAFALVQLNWLVFSKIDYMSNTVLEYIQSKTKNEEYKDYNINYLKIVNTFIKNMLSLYTAKFYETLEEIFTIPKFDKYQVVYTNICSLQSIMDFDISIDTHSQEEQVNYYNEFAGIINDSYEIIKQIKDESIATRVS